MCLSIKQKLKVYFLRELSRTTQSTDREIIFPFASQTVERDPRREPEIISLTLVVKIRKEICKDVDVVDGNVETLPRFRRHDHGR